MLIPSYTRKFEKDVKRARKRGKDLAKFEVVSRKLIAEQQLESVYRDHRLFGDYTGHRECHLEPDWLLIYRLEPDRIVFERMGTHSDLFRQ